MVSLQPSIESPLLRYVNRLSDLLFVAARLVNTRAGVVEIEW
jgi:cob(I)alamin adenosyltransferase